MNVRTLSVRVEGAEIVDYVEHVEMSHDQASVIIMEKGRIRIHDDGYKAQSYGVVERWNDSEWKEVATITGAGLSDTGRGMVIEKKSTHVRVAAFNVDRNRLIALAEEVLEW